MNKLLKKLFQIQEFSPHRNYLRFKFHKAISKSKKTQPSQPSGNILGNIQTGGQSNSQGLQGDEEISQPKITSGFGMQNRFMSEQSSQTQQNQKAAFNPIFTAFFGNKGLAASFNTANLKSFGNFTGN